MVREPTEDSLPDLCFSANTGRSPQSERVAFVAGDEAELGAALEECARDPESAGIARGFAEHRAPRVAFLFPGQGTQMAGMGKELYEASPAFRARLDRCAEIADPHLERPLLEVMWGEGGEGSDLATTRWAQPTLFALEWSLADWWRELGIEPCAVIGHSFGELVAACFAGVWELEEALPFVCERAKRMHALPPGGTMAAVIGPREKLARVIDADPELWFGSLNADRHTVVAGTERAISGLREKLERGFRVLPIEVRHAFHTPAIAPALDGLEHPHASAARVPLASNVHGRMLAADEVQDEAYWRRQILEPVRFQDALQSLVEAGVDAFLEVGARSDLCGMGRLALEAPEKFGWHASQRPGKGSWDVLLECAGALWVAGTPLDLGALDRGHERLALALPTYPFQRRRHWVQRVPESALVALPAAQSRDLRDPEVRAIAAAEAGAEPMDALGDRVLEGISGVCGTPVARLRPGHNLQSDLGFDSLMTVELDRRIRRMLPGLEDREAMFTEETTVGSLIELLSSMWTGEAHEMELTTHQREPKVWKTYADLIQMDPELTYVGGAFKHETHHLRDLVGEGRSMSGVLDCENKYAGSSAFHLTQMAAYAFMVQLIHGYLCYKHGVGKNDLGMPKLRAIDMTWHRMVRTSKDVPGTIRELSCEIGEDGVHTLEIEFDLAEGGVTGRLVGYIPIEPAEVALEQRTRTEWKTYAELLRKDPHSTYTGGTFKDEKQLIRDIVADGRSIKARLDVSNQFSGTPSFHLTQMGSYSCMVQLLLGYMCYKHGITKEDLGMPVLQYYSVRWREMVPFAEDIYLELYEKTCVRENNRYQMEFGFKVGDDHGEGSIVGMVPAPPGS